MVDGAEMAASCLDKELPKLDFKTREQIVILLLPLKALGGQTRWIRKHPKDISGITHDRVARGPCLL
jgi:hypothetical protein